MKKCKNITFMLLIIMAAYLTSCDLVQTGESTGTGVGKVAVMVTDAPFPVKDVKNVFVNVDKVELRVEGGLCQGPKGEVIGKGKDKDKKPNGYNYQNFDCDSGFVSIFSATKPVEIDLLKLQNGITTMLSKSDIPVGKYDILRLHIVNATVVMSDANYTLTVNSGAVNGLKIGLDSVLVVTEGETISQILLDFDLSRSFIAISDPKGKKGIVGFVFEPVIRAINHQHSGAIYGTVTDKDAKAVEGALVTVISKATAVTTAITDSKGAYKVIGLKDGTYTLKVEKDGYTTVNTPNLKVKAKSDIRKDIVLLKK